jgi:hypothetical protein
VILDPAPERAIGVFHGDLAVPDSHLSVYPEYLSSDTRIEQLFS